MFSLFWHQYYSGDFFTDSSFEELFFFNVPENSGLFDNI